ncbi:unnamed protein product [Ectocarpus sp. 12 AP-2014]
MRRRTTITTTNSSRGGSVVAVLGAMVLLSWTGGGSLKILPAVKGENYCDAGPASSTAGNPDLASDFTIEHDFACEDGYFLVGVEVWAGAFVESMRWRCSNGDESPTSDNTSPDGIISFTDGAITAIEATAHTNTTTLEFLGLMYIGGFYFSEESISTEGPFGDGGNYSTVSTSTSCEDGAYATGVRQWYTESAVYGIMLQCAELSETCSPGVAAADALADALANSDGGGFFEFSDWSIVGGAALGVWVFTFFAALVWCCFFRAKKSSTAATAGEEEQKEGEAGGGRASSTAATAGGEEEGGPGRGGG